MTIKQTTRGAVKIAAPGVPLLPLKINFGAHRQYARGHANSQRSVRGGASRLAYYRALDFRGNSQT